MKSRSFEVAARVMWLRADRLPFSACSRFFLGIIEVHEGRASSRVKDLVDILIYLSTEELDGDDLCHWCRFEARVRGIELPARFAVPQSWWMHYTKSFEKLVRGTGLDEELSCLDEAERLLDSVLSGEEYGCIWDCRQLE